MIQTLQTRSGFSMPSIGMGLWRKSYKKNLVDPSAKSDPTEDARERAGLEHAYESGMRLFDTAVMYGWGHSEKMLGEFLTDIERSTAFVTTKIWDDAMGPQEMLASVEKSLGHLQTDYLDLLLLHRAPTEPFTLESAANGLDACVSAGLVRNVGVCNFGVEKLAEITALTESPIVANQVHYNVEVREAQLSGLMDYAASNDVIVQAWRPLAYGTFTGSDFLTQIAARYEATAAQVALAWLIQQPNVATVFKSDNPRHIDENLKATTLQLSDEDLALIEKEFPNQLAKSDTVPLA